MGGLLEREPVGDDPGGVDLAALDPLRRSSRRAVWCAVLPVGGAAPDSTWAGWTPLPPPGVYARHNAVDTPALLPDGSPSELSISRVLRARGDVRTIESARRGARTRLAEATVPDSATPELEAGE